MQNMLSNYKICLNIINISTYDESLSNLSKIGETVQFPTCTNFLLCCQQTTKTISNIIQIHLDQSGNFVPLP